MPKQIDGFTKQFSARHPEVGEIEKGEAMSTEKAEALGEIFDGKIKALSRKRELTFEEERFLDGTADLGARNIVYALKVYGIGVPPGTARELIAKADTLTGNAAAGLRHPVEAGRAGEDPSDSDIERALGAVTGGAAGATIAEKPYLRSNVEDFAGATVTGFADMIREHTAAGGTEMPIDAYLAGNLQNMLARYEMAEASGAAAELVGQAGVAEQVSIRP